MLLRLSQDWGLIFSDNEVPCVREVGLHEPETDDRDEAVWLIEAKGDTLSAVSGRTYTVRTYGIGWGETNVRF